MGTSKNILMTPIARLSFPNLMVARGFEGQEPNFSCVLVFPAGTDLKDLKKAAHEAAKAKWPDESRRPKKLRSPFRDSAEKNGLDGFPEGSTFITCKTKRRPGVIDGQKNPITDAQDIYPGCWVRATVKPFAYDHTGNRGVSFSLNNVQKVKEGDPLGAFSKAEDDFDEVENWNDEEEATPGDEEGMFA